MDQYWPPFGAGALKSQSDDTTGKSGKFERLRLGGTNLKLSKKETAEALGAFAVVASLLFVGLQLYLDRKVALVDQYFNRGESAKADRRTKLESDAYFKHIEESWALGWRPYYWDEEWLVAQQIKSGERTVAAVMANEMGLRLDIIGYDSLYYQYQHGLLNEESWNQLRTSLKISMAADEFRRHVYQAYVRANLRPVIEEIVKEIETGRDASMQTE